MIDTIGDDLPDVNAPLLLADGTKIDPITGEVLKDAPPKMVEVPSATEAVKLVTATRRRIADLPDIPKRMHVVGAVLSYRLFGFDDHEIALATGMTVDQVGRIIMSDAYTTLHDKVVQGILSAEADSVRNIFTQGARDAARNVATMAKRDDALGFRAAQDVLDRAGMRPVDVVEHRHRMDGELHIVHIRRTDNEKLPEIDLDHDAA